MCGDSFDAVWFVDLLVDRLKVLVLLLDILHAQLTHVLLRVIYRSCVRATFGRSLRYNLWRHCGYDLLNAADL